MAVITPGVFQVVAMMVRSNAGDPLRRRGDKTDAQPGGDILGQTADTYTVLSGAISARGGGTSSARKA